MPIEIKIVSNRIDLRKFIHLPWSVHKTQPKWSPPLLIDEWRYFDQKINKNFGHSDTVMLLAYKNDILVGRVMGIINNRFNQMSGEKTARFGFLECFDDNAVASSFLKYVEDWAKNLGMKKVVGPMGFTDQDPEGYIIEGFGFEPTIATYYNFEYIPKLLEQNGYVKEVDYYVYEIPVVSEPPDIYKKVLDRIRIKNEFQILEFASRKQLKPYIIPILSLMNHSFRQIYGFSPLTEEEMMDLANQYLPVLNPNFVKAVRRDNDLVGFILAMPNMDEGFRKANGRLLPFGIIHILSAGRKSKQLDLLLGAIDERYRGRGIDVMLGDAMMKSAYKLGFEMIDTHLELESNTQVRSEMERVGGKIYKKYRIYQKIL